MNNCVFTYEGCCIKLYSVKEMATEERVLVLLELGTHSRIYHRVGRGPGSRTTKGILASYFIIYTLDDPYCYCAVWRSIVIHGVDSAATRSCAYLLLCVLLDECCDAKIMS